MKLIKIPKILYALGIISFLSSAANADLRAAKNFVVLSGHDAVTFEDYVTVQKPIFPHAVTCPAGTGCTVNVGGTSVFVEANDKIDAQVVTHPNNAFEASRDFSHSLSSLSATQTLPPIHLKPGTSSTISAHSGLNVVNVPSILAGTKHSWDHCLFDAFEPSKPGATLTITGDANSFVVVNVGRSGKPGELILCNHSKVVLSGGITPDKVIFNVVESGEPVRMGHSSIFNGTVLAPKRAFKARKGQHGLHTLINGAILAGGDVDIGHFVDINFYPLSEIAIPAPVTIVGTVNVQNLPSPPIRTTTDPADDFDPAPFIESTPGKPGPLVAPSGMLLTGHHQINSGFHALGPTLNLAQNFLGLSQNGKTPSDTQLAVGHSRVIQMVNITGAFYNKSDGKQTKTFDLGQFFLGSTGQGTDPRVLFDTSTNTFFAAYELHPSGGDDIRLAVASDPGDNWTVYEVRTNNSNLLFDQPKLGVSDDKVTISWNEYDAKGNFSGADYIVIQKAGLIHRNNSVPAVIWGPDSNRFQIVPVASLTSDGGNHYAAYHNGGDSNIHLMTFTGVPGVSNVSFTDDSFGIGSVSGPPAASQPSGGDANITTNDDRLLSAVWQNNSLWASFNEGCTPQGDTSSRACERFVQINTGRGKNVIQNVQLQSPGQDVYFSAVTLNGNGDLFFGSTISSSSVNPEATAFGVPGATFGPVTGGFVCQTGSQAFSCGCGTTGSPPTPASRWGDYAGAATDPDDPTSAWIVQQFGGISSPAGGWGTGIARLSFTSPPPGVTRLP